MIKSDMILEEVTKMIKSDMILEEVANWHELLNKVPEDITFDFKEIKHQYFSDSWIFYIYFYSKKYELLFNYIKCFVNENNIEYSMWTFELDYEKKYKNRKNVFKAAINYLVKSKEEADRYFEKIHKVQENLDKLINSIEEKGFNVKKEREENIILLNDLKVGRIFNNSIKLFSETFNTADQFFDYFNRLKEHYNAQ